jgi:hypothetical protein
MYQKANSAIGGTTVAAAESKCGHCGRRCLQILAFMQ